MHEEDYIWRNQVLKINTENLTIRIEKNGTHFTASCYFNLPFMYNPDDRIEIAEDFTLKASTLEFPLFSIHFSKCKIDIDYDFDCLDCFQYEAFLAIRNVLKWEEYWQ
ncbi:MAG: hypothetical protein HFJ41_00200 [Clostridia bacterium]|nr:hypothetical protein [Clostridia bacterium]